MALKPGTLLFLFLFTMLPAWGAAPDGPLPGTEDFREGKTILDGFVPILVDEDTGRVYLEVSRDLGPFILQTSLARGIGSNDIGLDRGRLGDTQLTVFERVGRKALLVAENTRYRATAERAMEQLAATEAFARSAIWGFKVVASSDDSYVIDYTDYLLSDSYHISSHLKRQKQGDFKVMADRSVPYLPMTRAFPDNSELEAMITLVGSGAGDHLESVTPDPTAVTVHVHHSLVRLPPPGYRKRAFHPASGYFPLSYADYSSPVESDLVQRFIRRHRLEKIDPGAARSRAVEPIVYYLDPGVPEPVRSALLDGARWWNQAFEAAGFIDAFQVKMLPEDADPMDVRYNIIQWVHRSTRGWSYGMSVFDPRTGEILKGKVTLGSLRIRQDILIAQGLLAPYQDGVSTAVAADELKQMALARIRQLSAHEIGHTLGLVHNFSASTYNRGSVMDYPHPLLKLDGDRIDLTDAYDTDIGEWDKHAIAYGYSVTSDEEAFLAAHIARGRETGFAMIADADARPLGGAHPSAHLWDSGEDIVEALATTMRVREIALQRFGPAAIPPGTPMATLEEVLVPLYYLHRYQVEAVVKLLGGVRYDYAMRGEGAFSPLTPVSATEQTQALTALTGTLSSTQLTLPANVLGAIVPKPLGYRRTRESAPSLTQPVFDPVTTAEAIVEMIVAQVLHPQRMARVRQQHAVDGSHPGVAGVVNQLLADTVFERAETGIAAEVQRRRNRVVIEHLLLIAFGEDHSPEVRSEVKALLKSINRRLRDTALRDLVAGAIEDGVYERNRQVAKMPPGSPI